MCCSVAKHPALLDKNECFQRTLKQLLKMFKVFNVRDYLSSVGLCNLYSEHEHSFGWSRLSATRLFFFIMTTLVTLLCSFRTSILGKGMNHIFPRLWVNSCNYCSFIRMVLDLIHPWSLICHYYTLMNESLHTLLKNRYLISKLF